MATSMGTQVRVGRDVAPGGRQGGLEVLDHQALHVPVEVDAASGRQEREAGLDLLGDLAPRRVGDGGEPLVEPELLVLPADEVEDGQAVLVRAVPQSSAELLQEHGGALGRPEEQDRVDGRHVDALVEQIDGEHDVDVAVP